MQGGTWQDYGTTGTQALGHEEIEQAIAQLERMWDDARSHARTVTWFSLRKSAATAATSRTPDRLTGNVRWS
jgi:hypothetical protein